MIPAERCVWHNCRTTVALGGGTAPATGGGVADGAVRSAFVRSSPNLNSPLPSVSERTGI